MVIRRELMDDVENVENLNRHIYISHVHGKWESSKNGANTYDKA